MGLKAAAGQNAMTLSDQIGSILASGTQGNPRQIKRFLNALLLRHATAEARGFGDEVLLPPLAKLMLAERYIPTLFDQVASAAAVDPDGLCRELALLEAAVVAEATQPKTPKAKDGKAEKANRDDEEPHAERVEGRGVDPAMGHALAFDRKAGPSAVPLRRKGSDFGPASALGRLAAVIDQLMGPRLAVQQYEAELRQLVPAEAA